jgi:hypothetical protein
MSYYNDEYKNWVPERGMLDKPRKNRKEKNRNESSGNKAWKHRKEKARRESFYDE